MQLLACHASGWKSSRSNNICCSFELVPLPVLARKLDLFKHTNIHSHISTYKYIYNIYIGYTLPIMLPWWCYLLITGLVLYALFELHYFLRMCLCVILARFVKRKCHILETTTVAGEFCWKKQQLIFIIIITSKAGLYSWSADY